MPFNAIPTVTSPCFPPLFNVINYDGRLGKFLPPFLPIFKTLEGGKATEDELEGTGSVHERHAKHHFPQILFRVVFFSEVTISRKHDQI